MNGLYAQITIIRSTHYIQTTVTALAMCLALSIWNAIWRVQLLNPAMPHIKNIKSPQKLEKSTSLYYISCNDNERERECRAPLLNRYSYLQLHLLRLFTVK